MSTNRPSSPIDRAVNLFVYAPIGLFFEAPRILPRLVERGRHEASTMLESGRALVGRASGSSSAGEGSHAHNTMRSLGLVRDRSDDSQDATTPESRGEHDRSATNEREVEAKASSGDQTPVETEDPGPDPDELAIPEYESLSASQVVPRLSALSPEELEAVRDFELSHRHRSTILNKVAQLRDS